MFRNVFLIDITEHRGLEQSAISSVQAYATEHNPELIDWFKLSQQAQPEVGIGGRVFSGLETGPQLWPQIRQRLLDLSSNGFMGSIFHVVSYDPYILAEARKLDRPELTIKTIPLAVLLTRLRSLGFRMTYSTGPTSYRGPNVGTPTALSVFEGLELTKRVLKEGGHTSQQTGLLIVKLRPLLMEKDIRAKKNPADRSSKRLIPDIIAAGLQAGCIHRYDVEGIPGTERIFLVDNESPETISLPLSGNGTAATTQTDVATCQLDSPDLSNPLTALVEPAESTKHLVTTKRDRNESRDRIRTQLIIKTLKEAGVYTPKPQRDALFSALRSCVVAEGEPKTLLQVSREIRTHASKNLDVGTADFPYWHPATEGFIGMLLGAGVLKDGSDSWVKEGLFARGSRIRSFKEPLEDTCEAFLLETAVKRVRDITKRDRIPLAHALFWGGAYGDRDKVEDRLQEVQQLLAERLFETQDGVWDVQD